MNNLFKRGWALNLIAVLVSAMTSCAPIDNELGEGEPLLEGIWHCEKFDYLSDDGSVLMSDKVSVTMTFYGYLQDYNGRYAKEEYEGHAPAEYLYGVRNSILTLKDHDEWITTYRIDVLSDEALVLTQLNDGVPSTRKYFKRIEKF